MSKRSWYGNVVMVWCPPGQAGGGVARSETESGPAHCTTTPAAPHRGRPLTRLYSEMIVDPGADTAATDGRDRGWCRQRAPGTRPARRTRGECHRAPGWH